MRYFEFEIETLEDHKRNLKATTNWEEYREAHVAYIDILIQHYNKKRARTESIDRDYDHDRS